MLTVELSWMCMVDCICVVYLFGQRLFVEHLSSGGIFCIKVP